MRLKHLIAAAALVALVAPLPAQAGIAENIYSFMATTNAELEASGADIRLEVVEYYTGQDEAGQTVFFSNTGNKQLGFDFVPGDPRRVAWSGPVGSGDDITWATDLTQGDAGGGIGLAATQAEIAAAMATWQNAGCSNLPLTLVGAAGNVGVVEFILSGGALGSPNPAADVTQAGFSTITDFILPSPIIAAAFTFRFIDGAGNSTDIDNNGVFDAAFREIYYTGNFPWSVGGVGGIDIQTVVLHETGHGLSQAHFGKAFRTDANGKIHFSPRAVMNAGYSGVNTDLTATDLGGHCSNWGSWPNN